MIELKFIKEMNLKSLNDAILDYSIRDTDAIYLHSNDFDDIANEYRETYKESIVFPFTLLGVFITTNEKIIVPPNEIRIVRNILIPQVRKIEEVDEYPPFDTVYICDRCGNVVDYNGNLLTMETREEHIRILEKFNGEVKRIHVNVECCQMYMNPSTDNRLWI